MQANTPLVYTLYIPHQSFSHLAGFPSVFLLAPSVWTGPFFSLPALGAPALLHYPFLKLWPCLTWDPGDTVQAMKKVQIIKPIQHM